MKWTKQDSDAARNQGWDVFEIWDMATERAYLEIQCTALPGHFITDEAARAFVKLHQNDPLCAKAATIVFKSKIPERKDKKK